MSFQERILSSTPRRDQLLQLLSSTSSASSAVQQTKSYISRLESQIATETKNIEKLSWRVSEERTESEEVGDARLHKLFDKSQEFKVKPEKEEWEYRQVLEAQTKAEWNVAGLRASLAEAQRRLPTLLEASTDHENYQSELGALYDSVFSAPRPPLLTLDIAISLLSGVQASLDQTRKPFDAAAQTVQLLIDAQKHLGFALNSVNTAQNAARREPNSPQNLVSGFVAFGGNGNATGIERNAMSQAQTSASQAEALLISACRLRPSIRNISQIQNANPDFLVSCGAAIGTDIGTRRNSRPVLFNAFRFKEKMDTAERDLKRVIREVSKELGMARERVAGLKRQVDESEERVRDAEEELKRAREEIWGRVVNGEDVGGEYVGNMGGGLFGELRLEALPNYAI